MEITNPFVPHFFNRLRVRGKNGTRSESVTREPTYNFQLRAFLAATRGDKTNLTDGHEGIRNMRVIDAIYAKAGMLVRRSE
jgi:predicted dehydrogenase